MVNLFQLGSDASRQRALSRLDAIDERVATALLIRLMREWLTALLMTQRVADCREIHARTFVKLLKDK
jgi:hypothetical protein